MNRAERALHLFRELRQTTPLQTIADRIGLHPNTVKRWEEAGAVPSAYEGDLLRMTGKDGSSAAAGNKVRDKDQFFTKPETARHCYRRLQEAARTLEIDLNAYRFIEPSAGGGAFYRLMPPERRIGIDIDPQGEFAGELIRADFLRWNPDPQQSWIVLGNPPFGLRGHLALQFLNRAAEFADLTAFILPQLFESDGKGAAAKRVDPRYRRALSKPLPPDSFVTSEGRGIQISAVFQVWTKTNLDRLPVEEKRSCDSYISVYSLSDGGTPASTRNKNMLYRCDLYLPSTCFAGMRAYECFEELPHRRGYGVVVHAQKEKIVPMLMAHNWENTAFRSTNGALNLRTSLIQKVVIDGGFADAALHKSRSGAYDHDGAETTGDERE